MSLLFSEFRKCGKAVCDGCSTKKSALPYKGHEIPVRVCEECYIGISEEEEHNKDSENEHTGKVILMLVF